jgi:hypothetical protein
MLKKTSKVIINNTNNNTIKNANNTSILRIPKYNVQNLRTHQ